MNDKPLFAEVILPLPLLNTFTYSVPDELKKECKVGKRAIVSFGIRKKFTAIIASLHYSAPTEFKVKEIEALIDEKVFINKKLLQLWAWAANYYLCSQGDFYKASVPSALRLSSETIFVANKDYEISAEKITEIEKKIYQHIAACQAINLKKLEKQFNQKGWSKSLHCLIEKGALFTKEEISKQKVKVAVEKIIQANFKSDERAIQGIFEKLKKAKKQLELFNFFVENYLKKGILEVEKTMFLSASKSRSSVLKGVVEKNIFVEIEQEVSAKEICKTENLDRAKKLNEHQEEALNKIDEQFAKFSTVLLHGVTSSGKTEIYIHLIIRALKEKKRVLYLLPEIVLTSQIVQRLKAVFGKNLGVYHSKVSEKERLELWNNLQQNNENTFKIIIGVRSSILLPFNDLGLIIVDEEHENTYKQFEPNPRYNARNLAVVLAKIHCAKVLFGSATPSIENYYNAQKGLYGLVELTKRYKNIELPEILLADIRKAYKKKQMYGIFSPLLLQEMEKALSQKEQIILFQNRRGFSPYLICKDCSWIPTCKNCDVSLTYHKHSNRLICHYCGFQMTSVSECKSCKSANVQTKGFGTEKIEEEVGLIFPKAKINRLDLDTAKSKLAYEKIIQKFEQKKTDILIGTQMISKGLDFENVSLVGILDADSMLSYPDFRAYERSFQLMIQVSGRGGRKNKRGKVIIQTNDVNNNIINHVIKNNYVKMFEEQIAERNKFIYPPFVRLIKITLKHKNKEKTLNAAFSLFKEIEKIQNIIVLGPISPIVSRVQSYYLQQLLIKIPKNNMQTSLKSEILKKCETLLQKPTFKQVFIIKDVDPL